MGKFDTAKLESVAAQLDGDWHVETPYDHSARLIRDDGVTIWVRPEGYGANAGRWSLTCGTPDDYEYSEGDDHGLDRPAINVSPERDATALARDINRRMIPKAAEFWEAVAGRIERRKAARNARETAARELAGLMGTTAREWRGDWSADLPEQVYHNERDALRRVYGDMKPSYDGTEVTVEIRNLPIGRARELARLIDTWRNA